MKILRTPRLERCIGCHSCSPACARQVYRLLSWDTAGIRIASSGGLKAGCASAFPPYGLNSAQSNLSRSEANLLLDLLYKAPGGGGTRPRSGLPRSE
jgi:Fe-S-cluster-containing hydrogenase component 2